MSAPPDSRLGNAAAALAVAEAARQAQLRIRARLLRDIAVAWPSLNFQHIARTWPGWVRMMTELITRYHAESADQAGLFYRAARQMATGEPGDPELLRLAVSPATEWIERALGYAAPGWYEKQVTAGAALPDAEQSALTQVLGTASRVALDGARTTVTDTAAADARAVGFYRVTDGDPCAFCALLASRGVVYKSAKSAGEGTDWHNDCGCTVAPAFSRDIELPSVSRRAADVYLNRGRGPALPAFRKAWNAQRPSSAA